MLLSCSATGAEPPKQPILTGEYTLVWRTAETKGRCDFIKSPLTTSLRFARKGNLVTPITGLECTTSYPFELNCEGFGVKLKAYPTDEVTEGANILAMWGKGEMVGPLWGCESLTFDFWLGDRR